MQTLLILHGAIGASDQFKPLSEALSPDFNVINFDFPGHGLNTKNKDFSIHEFAMEVLNFLKEKEIEKINIFGYSMGGYVALYLASHHPELINKVFTLATKFNWTPEIAGEEIKLLNPESIKSKVPAFAEILNDRHQSNDWKRVLKKTTEMMVSLGNKPELGTEDFRKISLEVRIAVGDNDKMVSIDESLFIQKNISNSSFLVLPKTPHPIEKVNLHRLQFEIKEFFQ